MSLAPGAKLGPYEIVAPLGAGGMGEVYRARDTKLNRDVAIKVLPAAFADDRERLARFTREAQTLASLNHPNIAQIYGIEGNALVMELVDGDDLSALMARSAGPQGAALQLPDVLAIAKQIADALEAAHELGIVHRDLKPANIKVRADGTVKVLDFGLAKAMQPAGASASADAMNSPTITSPAITEMGMILGTAAYMAPEQARGKAVDKRADVWAFGVIVYEMLAGTRLFSGAGITDVLAAVLRQDIDWTALPAETPIRLRRLLERCLDRDPKSRLRDIGEARVEIARIQGGAIDTTIVSGPAPRPVWVRVLPWALTAVGFSAALAAILLWAPWHTAAAPAGVRFEITPTYAAASTNRQLAIALSPDGTHLVYQAGTSELQVRAIDQLEPVGRPDITDARQIFISPDSQSIGFFAAGFGANFELKRAPMMGGRAIALCTFTDWPRGATWGDDDAIVVATTDQTTGLLGVSSGGGNPSVLTRPDAALGEADHVLPFALPGGRAVLFTIVPGSNLPEDYQIAVLDRKTGQKKTLIRGGSQAEYVGSAAEPSQAGYIVYTSAGTLRAVRFDPGRLEILSDPVALEEQARSSTDGTADFVVSRTGALAYVAGGMEAQAAHRTLVWVDRSGHEELIKAPLRAYDYVRLSPDGTRVAVSTSDQGQDIWTWDLARQTLNRLTVDPAPDFRPVWTRDSRRIIFSSDRVYPKNLFWHAADGTGTDERLTTSANAQYPVSVTPDGHLLIHELFSKRSWDIAQLALDATWSAGGAVAGQGAGQQTSELLVRTASAEYYAQISPDGRYVAYLSHETGRSEIYVCPYPKVNDQRWLVSTDGGHHPVWARSGRELFYVNAGTLMSVPVQAAGPTLTLGQPAQVFGANYSTPDTRNYDVSLDGRRFLMIKDLAGGSVPTPKIVVVLNWLEELKTRVVKK